MEEIIICRLCLENISNYICVDCLGNSVSKWIEAQDPNLLNDFKIFQEFLKNHFASFSETGKCVRCRNSNETAICPYCYTKEILSWLSTKSENLSKIFKKIFNFDFLNVGYSEGIEVKNWSPPLIIDEEEPDMNICESCGNQSEFLYKVNGSYICENCRDVI
jgi:hypothetical protein